MVTKNMNATFAEVSGRNVHETWNFSREDREQLLRQVKEIETDRAAQQKEFIENRAQETTEKARSNIHLRLSDPGYDRGHWGTAQEKARQIESMVSDEVERLNKSELSRIDAQRQGRIVDAVEDTLDNYPEYKEEREALAKVKDERAQDRQTTSLEKDGRDTQNSVDKRNAFEMAWQTVRQVQFQDWSERYQEDVSRQQQEARDRLQDSYEQELDAAKEPDRAEITHRHEEEVQLLDVRQEEERNGTIEELNYYRNNGYDVPAHETVITNNSKDLGY